MAGPVDMSPRSGLPLGKDASLLFQFAVNLRKKKILKWKKKLKRERQLSNSLSMDFRRWLSFYVFVTL